MISNFDTWKLIENLGNGKEEFNEILDYRTNLHVHRIQKENQEISEIKGKLLYGVELEVDKTGIEDIYFTIKKIELEIDMNEWEDDGSSPAENDSPIENKQYTLVITEDLINKDNVGVEVNSMPFYIESLEMDFRDVKDLNDKEQLKNIKYELVVGSRK